MLNTATGEVKKFQSHEMQNEKEQFKKLKYVFCLITENWWGNDTELLITLNYDKVPLLPQVMSQDFESLFRKLQRRLKQKLLYVIVLLYSTDGQPRFELWVKSADNTEIVISQRTLQSIWTQRRCNYDLNYRGQY